MNNKYLLILFMFATFVFAKDKQYSIKEDVSIMSIGSQRPVLVEDNNLLLPNSREEIDLWVEDFEGNTNGEWSAGAGWQVSTDDYNSASTSMLSPNDVTTQGNVWDLVSPIISLPALGEGETMNFSFFLKGDTPDTDGNGDNYLEDYYSVSILDLAALAWKESSTNSLDGNSYWCGEEDIGNGNPGYLNDWLQFLDTPSFVVPPSGVLSADMSWYLESAAGAAVAGTCVDGWDAANVRISADGGQSWNLLTANERAYDFDCGYGWLHHDTEYDTGGSLNNLAPGWGDTQPWSNFTFNLGQWSGQEVIVRFAFGSDPGFCTLDDASATGFYVDNVNVSGTLDCSPETDCDVVFAGEVWVDQFYDYCDETRPGYQAWEEYVPGLPFNGNVFLDISSLAGKDVAFRFQTRYDEDDDGGSGLGIMVDDLRIYKVSGGNYPAPWDLGAEPANQSAELAWADMNASGTNDFIYDNDVFDVNNGIVISGDGDAWAAERFDIAGTSTVNSVSIYNVNEGNVDVTVGAFSQVGTLYNTEPEYSLSATLVPGWNDITVPSWSMNNSYLIGYTFSATVTAGLDGSGVGTNSMVLLGGGWDDWNDIATANALPNGEWGVRANITYDGANVTYNVYKDGVMDVAGLTTNYYTATGLTNNVTYTFSVSATYSDGEESDQSDSVEVTPQAQTVHEEYYDDGTAEEFFNAGSGNFTAVRYASNVDEDIVRFKWYQDTDGGAFYLKMFADDGGMPGDEIYSRVMAGGLVDGWNTYDLSTEGLTLSGAVWVGTKEFSSTKPVGLDTDSNSGNSYTRVGSAGEWTQVPGNLMIRVYLDCGENCSDEPPCTPADVNNDGTVNVLDIVSTVNFVMGIATPTDAELCAADLSGDGLINVLDIVAMVNIIVGT